MIRFGHFSSVTVCHTGEMRHACLDEVLITKWMESLSAKKRCWIECILQKWRIRWCRGVFLGVETLISPVRDGCYAVPVCPLLLALTVQIQVSTLNVCDRCGVMWCGWPGCERSIFMLTNCQHILALMWTADAGLSGNITIFFFHSKKKKDKSTGSLVKGLHQVAFVQ